MKKRNWIFFALFTSFTAFAEPWGLNDVSILYPLPATIAASDSLMKPTDIGMGGELLPRRLIDATIEGIGGILTQVDFEGFRVVAIRVDPFDREVRLVWQGIYLRRGQIFATNLGLHTFYSFNSDQWSAFRDNLAGLRAMASIPIGERLRVHPALAASNGLDSAFATQLKALILRSAGLGNLYRVSLMDALPGSPFTVKLGRIEVLSGEPRPSTIPGLPENRNTQTIRYGFDPESISIENIPQNSFSEILTGLNEAMYSGASDFQILRFYRKTLVLDSPLLTSTHTTDCASCHLATPVRNFFEENHTDRLAGPFSVLRATFLTSPIYNLENQEIDRTDRTATRGFGYIINRPSILQRTINDSALSAAYMDL